MKIKSIKKINYDGPVYNLQVEDNHNYITDSGIVLSNCHQAKSKSIKDITEKCINADYRIGLTGTLPDELLDQLTIYGYLGPKSFEMKSSELIDKGVLSKIAIANLILKYPKYIINQNIENDDYNKEVELINTFDGRNKVFDWIFKNIPKNQNTLILCQKIEHLKKIEKYINATTDRKVYLIYGGVEADERESIRRHIEEEESVVICGSYGTLSTGVNIKRLHNCIFASSYKSKIKILQSIGRGLRLHDSKEKLILWDLVDDLSYEKIISRGPNKGERRIIYNYVYNHFFERLDVYKNQGFTYFSKILKLEEL